MINVDGHPAYSRAISELKQSGELGRRCRCRPSPYLNNIIEQDHRFIKKRIAASLGSRSAEGAEDNRRLRGNACDQKRPRWLAKGDVVGQRQFIHTLFGIAARFAQLSHYNVNSFIYLQRSLPLAQRKGPRQERDQAMLFLSSAAVSAATSETVTTAEAAESPTKVRSGHSRRRRISLKALHRSLIALMRLPVRRASHDVMVGYACWRRRGSNRVRLPRALAETMPVPRAAGRNA